MIQVIKTVPPEGTVVNFIEGFILKTNKRRLALANELSREIWQRLQRVGEVTKAKHERSSGEISVACDHAHTMLVCGRIL